MTDQPEPTIVTRRFAAPRSLVFDAWTSAEKIRRWFAPRPLTMPEAVVEFVPGGRFELCMRTPDGQLFPARGHFGAIVAPERLEFTLVPQSPGGQPLFTARTIITFDEQHGATILSARQEYEIHTPAALLHTQGARQGWSGTLDNLEREVAS